MAYPTIAKPLLALSIAVVLAGMGAALPQQAHACFTKPATTVVKSGAYTFKVYQPKTRQWVAGGPNYRYQAALVKVNKRHAARYVIPKTVKWKGRSYHITEIDGDPFKACRKARSIRIDADLAYIEDMTFWRRDKRRVKLCIRNRGTYGYLHGDSTALIR